MSHTMHEERKYRILRAQLTIDQMQIDRELCDHPSVLNDACDCLATAIAAKDQADNYYKYQQAVAATALREETLADGKKRTDTRVAQEIANQENVQDALVRLEDAKADVALWSALVEGLRAKGSSLKRLAELMVTGYLAPNAAYEERRSDIARKRRTLNGA